MAYVSFKTEDETAAFFTEGRDTVPEQMMPLKGSLLIALTGLLICNCETLALTIISDGPWALHGRVHPTKYASPEEAFPALQDVYLSTFADDAEKSARWNLATFARLYGAVQMNATLLYIPLSTSAYGAGFFPGTVFFNHACNPNAIIVTTPGKCVIQAISPIEVGDEVTVAYKELPLDFLNDNLVRLLHFDAGIEDARGCCCEICRASRAADEETAASEGVVLPPAEFDPVELDLSKMWVWRRRRPRR